jgi:hypothetical protein
MPENSRLDVAFERAAFSEQSSKLLKWRKYKAE